MVTEKNSSAMKSILEPATKPLVDSIELKELARTHLLKEVNAEMQRLTESDTYNQTVIGLLEEIKQAVTAKQDNGMSQLKLEVLQKLKAKLETS